MKSLIYLLEDEKSISELVSCAMELAGLDVQVFDTCFGFERQMQTKNPDLAILDIMLPDGNGLDVLKRIRSTSSQLPVILMSALGRETDKVKGLNVGADDYIAKPFGVMELSARVAALLRRTTQAVVEEKIVVSDLEMDAVRHLATLSGNALELNAKEFALLYFMAKNKNIVLSREKLLVEVWGYDYVGETRTVDNHIARLRKLGLQDYLITVFGSGYKFIEPQ